MIWWGRNFAHVTTAELSRHVQTCDLGLTSQKVYDKAHDPNFVKIVTSFIFGS